MIYLRLEGRLGNQLFMYATARMIQKLKGDNDTIYIEDVGNQFDNTGTFVFDDVLEEYDLPNVVHIHDHSIWKSAKWFPMRCKWAIITHLIEKGADYDEKYEIAMKHQKLYNRMGFFHIKDGYAPYPKKFRKNVYVNGYFQSAKFFDEIADEIRDTFGIADQVEKSGYPNLKDIQNRNTVCISIKVHANIGNPMYDVCHETYYEKALAYITEHVENPLFFICSDNVEYVKEHLIDTTKYDRVCQDSSYSVSISLAVMAQCKHFIISNTSFGWWAQYLSKGPDKIVIVPDRWYNGIGQWQYDIYQDNMVIINGD